MAKLILILMAQVGQKSAQVDALDGTGDGEEGEGGGKAK